MTGSPGPVRAALSDGLRSAGTWFGTGLLAGSWLSAASVPGVDGPHLVLHASGALIAAGGGVLLTASAPRPLRPVQVGLAVLLMVAGFAVVLAGAAPAARPATTAAFPVAAAALALPAFAVFAGGRRAPLITAAVLVAGVEAVSATAGPANGLRWAPDVPVLALLALIAAVTLGFRRVAGRLTDSRRAAAEAAEQDALDRMRAIARSRAAAVVHDGVLGDLAALAALPAGPLPATTSAALRTTLDLLASPDWGSDDATGPVVLPGSAVLTAVRRAERAGLTVRVEGDPAALRGLDPVVEAELGRAVDQCLSNTRRHSGSDRAEVTVLGDRDRLSVMVADSGTGFDPAGVDADRMGLATSVAARLTALGGEARVFARPGLGTTVLLSVPRSAAG